MAGTTTYYGISYPTNTDYVKDGATAMQTIATGFDTAVAIPTYNNQTGTSYTFVLADTGKTVTSDNASAVTFTIPPQASVAWANNTTLTVRNLGAGVVTIAGGAGVTVTNTAQTVAQYGEVKLIRTASNAWTVVPASGSASAETTLASGTFTGVTVLNLTNVFSSTYSWYKFYVEGFVSTSAQTIFMRFRENTTDKATGYYGGGSLVNYLGTRTSINMNNTTQIGLTTWNTSSGNRGSLLIDITRPSATNGIVNVQAFDAFESGGIFSAASNTTMSNFTGLSLYPNAQTMTGSYLLTGIK